MQYYKNNDTKESSHLLFASHTPTEPGSKRQTCQPWQIFHPLNSPRGNHAISWVLIPLSLKFHITLKKVENNSNLCRPNQTNSNICQYKITINALTDSNILVIVNKWSTEVMASCIEGSKIELVFVYSKTCLLYSLVVLIWLKEGMHCSSYI